MKILYYAGFELRVEISALTNFLFRLEINLGIILGFSGEKRESVTTQEMGR